ncbi:recombination-associated protein RdgC [Candidatus Regiella insecticola]|uniref:Recombination-associated protein RdgC n=1 Tax=Candidatus Regiella insecticola TaxID=138073 RepID=A0A6L2ZKT4_9ENTR|nr:recombination-associated protein RdgC [Candidatus Regiella insecticola]GFN45172.1 recombination-associated protein RdgC [Candidatus Regiella insecticola]
MLWFKNLMIYRLSKNTLPSAEKIEEKLSQFIFSPCPRQNISTMGWVSPMGSQSDALIHNINNQIILCIRKEEKILPTAVIKQELQTQVDRLESKQHRKLKNTDKKALKDDIVASLAERAFSRFSQTLLWIDHINNFIMIDVASAKQAEDALALLRKSLGSLPVVPLRLETPIEFTLTQWIKSGDLPNDFTLMNEAELKAVQEDEGVIRCKQQDLVSDEIASHIEAGKQVTKLALDWRGSLQFVLNNDASLKRLKFADTLRKQNDNIDREDFAQRFDADFILMTGELRCLISKIIDDLGGEAHSIKS